MAAEEERDTLMKQDNCNTTDHRDSSHSLSLPRALSLALSLSRSHSLSLSLSLARSLARSLSLKQVSSSSFRRRRLAAEFRSLSLGVALSL